MRSLAILLMRLDSQFPDTRPLNQAISSGQAAIQRRFGTHDRATLAARLDSGLGLPAGRITNDGGLWLPKNLHEEETESRPIASMLHSPHVREDEPHFLIQGRLQTTMTPQVLSTLGNNLQLVCASAFQGLLPRTGIAYNPGGSSKANVSCPMAHVSFGAQQAQAVGR